MEEMINSSKFNDTIDENFDNRLQYQSNETNDNMVETDQSESIRNSSFVLKPINSPSTINRYPDLTVSDCDSTSIVITSEVDSEMQIAAQIFVEDLLVRARKEADFKISLKQQVIFITNRKNIKILMIHRKNDFEPHKMI